MPRKKTERPYQIHFRVTQKEYEIIKNKVEQSGLSMSEFARKTFLDKKIVSAPPADFPTLIREIKRVGGNLKGPYPLCPGPKVYSGKREVRRHKRLYHPGS